MTTTTDQDRAIEQAEKVRARVVAALAEIPGLYAYDDESSFTVTEYGAPTLAGAYWEDEPRPDGFGPDRQYTITTAVVTWLDAPAPLGTGYVRVTWTDDGDPSAAPRKILPMTLVPAADLGDGEPLARLAADAVRADRASQEG